MVQNCLSLRHLKLGCEKSIALPGLLGDTPVAEQELRDFTLLVLSAIDDEVLISGTQGLERRSTQRESSGLLDLQTLHLIGFDFRELTADSKALFLGLSGLSRINALTLESCFIDGSTFPLLSPQTAIESIWTPRLQSFSLRYEKSDATFQHQLGAFFGSFSGLVHLSVLLEGSDGYMKPECFIENHGKTLKTLVWDQRSKPRASIGQSTSIHSNDSIYCCTHAIARGCPGLRELGLSLPDEFGLTYWVSRYSYHPSLDDQDTHMCSGIWCTSTAE